MNSEFQLAHLNVAQLKAPTSDPLLADFVARIPGVNALGDSTPGFVWRLHDGSDEAGPDPFADPLLLINLSVWESVDALRAFVYAGAHAQVMRDRRRWFDSGGQAPYVLWWVRSGERPTLIDAKRRLESLRDNGPSPSAFTFVRTFPASSAEEQER